jgi:CDP-glucose 4,6-dehydratase
VSTLDPTVKVTVSVLEACRRTPFVEQVVVASSDKAYGDHDVLPYNEDSSLRAIHPYDVSKACVDLVTRSYALSFGLPAVITRCGNFFGPGDTNWRRLVPSTVRAVLEGRDPVIRSDGTALRDYLYIADAVRAYLSLAENLAYRSDLAGEAFNFAEGRPRRVSEVVAHIIRACGSERTALIENRAHREIAHQALDVTKAHEVLAWTAIHDFTEALEETVRWYRIELTGGPQ